MRFRNLPVWEYLKLASPFLCAVLLGAVLQNVVHGDRHHVLRAFSDGLLVAGFLGLGFELFATKSVIEHVADTLTGRLVGGRLPKPLQEHIVAIVKTNLVRASYHKSYRIRVVGDKAYVEQTVTFTVKNYSDRTINYTPAMDEESAFKPQFLYLEYGLEGKRSYCLNSKQLSQRVTFKHPPNPTTKLVDGKKSIRLKPHDEHAICHVKWQWTIETPAEFSDTTEFRNATLGATIQIEDKPADLEFACAGDNMLPHDPQSNSWTFNCPFIAGQTIRTRWWRSPDERRC